MLYLGSDHGGYNLKEDLKKFLTAENIEFQDLGGSGNPDDDYPEFSAKVAKAVQGDLQNNKGVLLCKSGQGVCIAANKFKGIRAGLAWNELVAKAGRNDDDINILCLPSDYISSEVATDILKTWLITPFSAEERRTRRLKEIEELEK